MPAAEVVSQTATATQSALAEYFSDFDSSDFYRTMGYMVLLMLIRVVVLKVLMAIGRSQYAETYRITKRPLINEKQHERESVWPTGFVLDALAIGFFYVTMKLFRNMSLLGEEFFWSGIAWHLIIHATVVEFIYYWWHRALHISWLYKNYHAYHHKSINTEPSTGLSFEIGERLSYTILFAVSPAICYTMGYCSILHFVLYFIWFDILNEGGHINFEMFPAWFFNTPLKYIYYTPSFHAIHHTRFKRNYSLFMPWPDMLWSTDTWSTGGPEEAALPTSNGEL